MSSFEFLKDIDFFGKEPDFYFRGKPKQATVVGRIFTIFYILIYIAIFAYKVYRMTQRVDITFYDSYSNTETAPDIKITNQNFTLMFAIYDDEGPYVDESVYFPGVYFMENGAKELEVELCEPEKINPEYKEIFDEWELENLYCLSNINFELKPLKNSIRIELYPCVGEGCSSDDAIDSRLNGSPFFIFFHDVILTPLDFDIPVKKKINYLNTEVFKGLGQYLNIEMQIVRVETSTNIIGFDFLTEPKIEDFIKYDNKNMYPYPGYDLDDPFHANYPAAIIELQLNDKIFSEKRYYIQLIDVLGEIGGLMEIIFSFFGAICSIVADIVYEKRITNDLFSFNIDKKLILFKYINNLKYKINNIKKKEENYINNKNQKIKYKESSTEIDIYRLNTKKINKNKEKDGFEESQDSVNMFQFKNNNNKRQRNLKGKRKKKSVQKNDIKISNNIDIEFAKQQNSNEVVIKNSAEVDLIYNAEKKANKDSKDNDGIDWTIDNIYLTDLLISKLYCCCKRQKRSVYNLLINESKGVIAEKLDVINIFRNLCSFEYSNDDLFKNLNSIKMSEECSKNILNLIK